MKTKTLIDQANELLPVAGKEIANILEVFIKRWKEIEEGKNHGTRYPVYCVYAMEYLYFDRDQDIFINEFNRCGIDPVNGFLYNSPFEYEFFETEDELIKYVSEYFGKDYNDISEIDDCYYSEVQQIAKERLVAVFLTSEAAHNYIERHNLSQPYVYVESSGYANYQFEF